VFKMDGINVTADELSINGAGGVIISGEGISAGGLLDSLVVDNLKVDLALFNGTFDLSGQFDLSASGLVLLTIENNSMNFSTLDVGGASVAISDFYLNYNDSMIISADSITIDATGLLLLQINFSQSPTLKVQLAADGSVTIANMVVVFDGITINLGSFSFTGSFAVMAGVSIGDNSIKISGELVMDVDVAFNINGTDGGLSGIFYFSSPSDSVYINWSAGAGFKNLSVEGTGEFSIDDFRFWFGDMVDISVEHLAGSFDLSNNGSVGRIDLLVDNSFVDVDINVALDLGDHVNLTLSGIFNVTIDGAADGNVWVSWNRTGDKPKVSFGGNLEGAGTIDASVTDLVFKMDGINVTADELSINGAGGVIISGEGISAGGLLDSLVVDNLKVNAVLMNGTLELSCSIDINISASGNISLVSNESGMLLDVDFDTGMSGSLAVNDFIFKSNLIGISLEKLVISGGLDVAVLIQNKNFTLTSAANLTTINVTGVNINIGLEIFSIAATVSFIGSGTIDFGIDAGVITAEAKLIGGSQISVHTLWVDVPVIHLILGIQELIIQGPTTFTINANTSQDFIGILTISTKKKITLESLTFGPIGESPGVPPKYLSFRNISIGTGGGSFGFGLDQVSSQPVIIIDGELYIGFIDNSELDLLINGSITIVGFPDVVAFSYVYLKGFANRETTITIGPLEKYIAKIIIEPGTFNILFNQQDNFGDITIVLSSSSWIKIIGPGGNNLRFRGCVDVHLNLDTSTDDGDGKEFFVDLKELSGVLVIEDKLRCVGEAKGVIDLSFDPNTSDDTYSLSNFNLYANGSFNLIMQVKTNETDWIPTMPYSTSGNVVILSGTTSNDNMTFKTVTDNVSKGFEIWYCPPFSFDSDYSKSLYTYTVSFGDGSDDYVLTTNKTDIFIPAHKYYLGGPYKFNVKVTVDGSGLNPVESSTDITVKNGDYLGIKPPISTLYFNYEDAKNGYIPYKFEIVNKAVKEFPYTLHWNASVDSQDPYREKLWDTENWTFEPSNGALNPGEKVTVNVSIKTPIDHADHILSWTDGVYITQDNTDPEIEEDDGGFYAVLIYDGRVGLMPFTTINLPDLNPDETITSSFWVRNVGRGGFNWTISEHPLNGTWTFSSPNTGYIPKGGSAPVKFTITAPDEYGVDLSGKIKVINLDNTSDYDTVHVNVKTKSNSSDQNNNIKIKTDGDNFSIRIGGKNEITLDNFTFEVNGVNGLINSHIVFDTDNSYVYINFTKGNLSTLSIDGDAEFTIEKFKFVLGDNISIIISKIITGGIHLREGKSGNFSVAVDNTFTDVDINLHLNLGFTNFSLKGNINIDADIVSDGYMWIDWDLTNNPPHIWIDGNFTKDGTINVSITDFNLTIANLTVTADTFILKRGVDFRWNETSVYLNSGANIETSGIHIIYKNDFEISALNAQCILDGKALFEFITYADHVLLHINTTGLTINGMIYARFREYEGSANIFLTIVGDLWISLYASDPDESTQLNHISIGGNGYVNVNQIYYLNNTNSSDNSQIVVTLKGIAYLETGIETIDIWWDLAAGYLKINATAFSHDGSPFFQLKNFTIEIQAKNSSGNDSNNVIRFSIGLITIDAGGCLILSNRGAEGSLSFMGIFEINDVEIVALAPNLGNFTMSLNLTAKITGDIQVSWGESGVKISGNAIGTGSGGLVITDLHLNIESLSVAAGIEYLSISQGRFNISFKDNLRLNVGANLTIRQFYIIAGSVTGSVDGPVDRNGIQPGSPVNSNIFSIGIGSLYIPSGDLTVTTDLAHYVSLNLAVQNLTMQDFSFSISLSTIQFSLTIGYLFADGNLGLSVDDNFYIYINADGKTEIRDFFIWLNSISVGWARLYATGHAGIGITNAFAVSLSGYLSIDEFWADNVPFGLGDIKINLLQANGGLGLYAGNVFSVGGSGKLLVEGISISGLNLSIGRIYGDVISNQDDSDDNDGPLVNLDGEGYWSIYLSDMGSITASGLVEIDDFSITGVGSVSCSHFHISGSIDASAKIDLSKKIPLAPPLTVSLNNANLEITNLQMKNIQIKDSINDLSIPSAIINSKGLVNICWDEGKAYGTAEDATSIYIVGSISSVNQLLPFDVDFACDLTLPGSGGFSIKKISETEFSFQGSGGLKGHVSLNELKIDFNDIAVELSGHVSWGNGVHLDLNGSGNADVLVEYRGNSIDLKLVGSVGPATLDCTLTDLTDPHIGSIHLNSKGWKATCSFYIPSFVLSSTPCPLEGDICINTYNDSDFSAWWMFGDQSLRLNYQSDNGFADGYLRLNIPVLGVVVFFEPQGIPAGGEGGVSLTYITEGKSFPPAYGDFRLYHQFGSLAITLATDEHTFELTRVRGPVNVQLNYNKDKPIGKRLTIIKSKPERDFYVYWDNTQIWPWTFDDTSTVDLFAKGKSDIWQSDSITVAVNENVSFKARMRTGYLDTASNSQSYIYDFSYGPQKPGPSTIATGIECDGGSYKYDTPGRYVAKVQVYLYDAINSTLTFVGRGSIDVKVGGNLKVNISASQSTIKSGETATFTATVEDNETNKEYRYDFDFGDGGKYSITSYSKSISVPRTYYNISLIGFTASVSVTKLSTNEWGEASCKIRVINGLLVLLTPDKHIAQPGENVNFTAKVLGKPGDITLEGSDQNSGNLDTYYAGDRYIYKFDFGDGTTYGPVDGYDSFLICHAYSEIGLMIPNVHVAEVTSDGTPGVEGIDFAFVYIGIGELSVTLSADPQTPKIDQQVNFKATVTNRGADANLGSNSVVNTGSITFADSGSGVEYKYVFDFGDGSGKEITSSSSSTVVTHSYTSVGEYWATVLVTSSDGKGGRNSVLVYVAPKGTVNIVQSVIEIPGGPYKPGDYISGSFQVENIGTGKLNWEVGTKPPGWSTSPDNGELEPTKQATVDFSFNVPKNDNAASDYSSESSENTDIGGNQLYMGGSSYASLSFTSSPESTATSSSSTLIATGGSTLEGIIEVRNSFNPFDYDYVVVRYTIKTNSVDAGMPLTVELAPDESAKTVEMIPKTYETESGTSVTTDQNYTLVAKGDGTYDLCYNNVPVAQDFTSAVEIKSYLQTLTEQEEQNTNGGTTDTTYNHPPVLSSIGDKSVAEGHTLSFPVSATDQDSDSLTFSLSGVGSLSSQTPTSYSFSSSEQQSSQRLMYYSFYASPDDNCVNEIYSVTITVWDGHGGYDTEKFSINVIDDDSCDTNNNIANYDYYTQQCCITTKESSAYALPSGGISYPAKTIDVTVGFDGSGSYLPGVDTSSYTLLWSFGDGEIGEGLTPTHNYNIEIQTKTSPTTPVNPTTPTTPTNPVNPTTPTSPIAPVSIYSSIDPLIIDGRKLNVTNVIMDGTDGIVISYPVTLLLINKDGHIQGADSTEISIFVPLQGYDTVISPYTYTFDQFLSPF